MNLTAWDHIVINTSGGKDSQAMLEWVWGEARRQGVADRLLAVHADLGSVEWPGASELAQYHAHCRGIPFHAVRRYQDLLAHIEDRGMFPSSTARYCTSDHKRDPIAKVIRRLQGRILNCMGLRAQESRTRARKPTLEAAPRLSTRTREVWTWLPIHGWTETQVWQAIERGGMPAHYAYALGMPRLSCCFCIFAPADALRIAGSHNRNLLVRYVALERRMGHTLRVDQSLAQILDDVDRGLIPDHAQSWNM